MTRFAIMLAFMLLNMNSCKDTALEVRTENRFPMILSVAVFPQVVGPSDSLVVVCSAIDLDGDTLVYDWYTTGVVRIKGAGTHPALYHTYENARVFYAPESSHVSSPQDTFQIQCAARDRRGGMDVADVFFVVTKDS